jgi:laccase
MAGEWWQMDLAQADWAIAHGVDVYFSASTINGKLGDLYNCSGNQSITLDITPYQYVTMSKDTPCSLRLN